MKVRVGCDIVNIKKFKKSVQRGRSKFLDKIFFSCELAGNPKIETLAGIFAAKEAVIKALAAEGPASTRLGEAGEPRHRRELKAGDWHKIEIMKNKNGRPCVKLAETPVKIISQDISISHNGEYAVAVAVFLLK